MVDKKLEKIIYDVYENLKKDDEQCFETGFFDLDDFLRLEEKGILITIGARPAMGKTAFLYNIMENVSKMGKKCFLFSLEMSTKLVVKRLISQISEVDTIKLRTGNMEQKDWDKIATAMSTLLELPISIDDSCSINIEEIESKIKEGKPDIVFIDYLQLFSNHKKMDRYTYIEHIMKELKRIADENKIIIFINSQLSRAIESRMDKRPMLSDLRESGGIENISDIVIFIYRPDYYYFDEEDYTQRDRAEIIVAKNKFGPTGTVNLKFIGRITKFFNLTKERFLEF